LVCEAFRESIPSNCLAAVCAAFSIGFNPQVSAHFILHKKIPVFMVKILK